MLIALLSANLDTKLSFFSNLNGDSSNNKRQANVPTSIL